MKRKKYQQVYEDEWSRCLTKNAKFACCDCGLTHSFDFRRVKGRKDIIEFKVRKDNRATGQIRRYMKEELAKLEESNE